MKKLTVGILVALMGVALSLQWYNKKKEAKLTDPGVPAARFELSSIPLGISGPSLPQQVTATRQPLGPVKGPDGSKGVCAGGTLNEILAGHGSTWGYLPDGVALDGGKTEILTEALEDYFTCRTASLVEPLACGSLSANVPSEDSKHSSKSARDTCQKISDDILMAAFMAGKHKDVSVYKRFIGRFSYADFSKNPEKYYPIFSNGQENVCRLGAKASGYMYKGCREAYPESESDCAHAAKPGLCWNRYWLYTAMKTGNPEICPLKHRVACRAYLLKSPSACSSLALKASSLYCADLKILKKKEDETRRQEARAEADRRQAEEGKRWAAQEQWGLKLAEEHKAEQKMLEETNKRIRKTLGLE
ncbi:MAG TPA: hypothetical protein PKI19_10010 [Elusimicrobiales bacterium]|nr:hypothetical protein [Elusimicrobiales bacterium]